MSETKLREQIAQELLDKRIGPDVFRSPWGDESKDQWKIDIYDETLEYAAQVVQGRNNF